MSPWEWTGNAIGWIVFGIVCLIGVVLALAILAFVGVLVVAIAQEIVKAIRTRTRPKLGAVLTFPSRKADDS